MSKEIYKQEISKNKLKLIELDYDNNLGQYQIQIFHKSDILDTAKIIYESDKFDNYNEAEKEYNQLILKYIGEIRNEKQI